MVNKKQQQTSLFMAIVECIAALFGLSSGINKYGHFSFLYVLV
jgi:hypothetical protein